MYITELYKPHNTGYESEKDDQSVLKLSDMRKHSRLTFADLNRLRMAHDVRKVEHESKLEKITFYQKTSKNTYFNPLSVGFCKYITAILFKGVPK